MPSRPGPSSGKKPVKSGIPKMSSAEYVKSITSGVKKVEIAPKTPQKATPERKKEPPKRPEPPIPLPPLRFDRPDYPDTSDDPSRTHIKPELRMRAQDVRPASLHVVARLYEKTDGSKVVALPTLLEIAPMVMNNDAADYREFQGRLSSWFFVGDKKPRTDGRAPPKKPLRHKCTHCAWSFQNASGLSRHMDTHNDAGVYACQACLTLFNYSVNVYEHWRFNCQPTVHDTSIEARDIPLSKLRSAVFRGICGASHANMFHIFNGIMFIPSETFLNDPNNVIMHQHQRQCHLCSLEVPAKFFECHGDVHRGRFRIDQPIFGFYFCHLCSMVFKLKKNLILHWRTKCREVVAHTPEEYHLDNEETVALAFLVLQQSIPHETIKKMMEYSRTFLKRFKLEHANDNGLLRGMRHVYSYFPQEIWPMQTHAGYDMLNDAFALDDSVKFAELAGRVHNCNLLATACPDFYATGMEWATIRVYPQDMNEQDALIRNVLRFTITGSAMKTYKVTGRALPRLRPRYSVDKIRAKWFNTDIEDKKCTICKKTLKCTFKNDWRLDRHLNGPRHKTAQAPDVNNCPVCSLLLYNRNREEHWQTECEAVKQFVAEDDRQFVDDRLIGELKEKMKVQKVTPSLRCVQQAPRKKGDTGPADTCVVVYKKPQDESMLYHECSVELNGAESAMRKVKETMVALVEKAKQRASRRQEVLKKTEPENEKRIVICAHCGGKYDAEALVGHLDRRHGYDRYDPAIQDEMMSWISSGGRDTLSLLKKLAPILAAKDKRPPPLMSDEQYANATRFAFNKDDNAAFTPSPWATNETTRNLEQKGPMLSMPNKLDTNLHRVVEAKKLEGAKPIYPEVTVKPEEIKDQMNRWLPVIENDGRPRHPRTGRLLPEPIASIVIETNRRFFSGDPEELLRLGFDADSLDFFNFRDEGSENEDGEDEDKEEELSVSENEEMEEGEEEEYDFWIHCSDEDDDDDEEDKDDSEEEDGSEEEEEYDDGAADEPFVEIVNDADRKKALEAAKKQWKLDSLAKITPPAYDREKFKAQPFPVPPHKLKDLQYLGGVVKRPEVPQEQKTVRETPKGMLALNIQLEHNMYNFRTTFKVYRDLYMAAFPSREINKNWQSVKLIKKNLFDFKELKSDDEPPSFVIDDRGVGFVGGLLLSKTFKIDSLDHFYLRMPNEDGEPGEMAMRMCVYNAQDVKGRYKFAWPAENSKYLTSKFSKYKQNNDQPMDEYFISLRRMELRPRVAEKTAVIIPAPARLIEVQCQSMRKRKWGGASREDQEEYQRAVKAKRMEVVEEEEEEEDPEEPMEY